MGIVDGLQVAFEPAADLGHQAPEAVDIITRSSSLALEPELLVFHFTATHAIKVKELDSGKLGHQMPDFMRPKNLSGDHAWVFRLMWRCVESPFQANNLLEPD